MTPHGERRAQRFAALFALLTASLVLACVPRPNSGGSRDASSESPHKALAIQCLPGGPETCFDAVDNNCNGAIDEGCGTPTGLVHIAISWREPEVDVDLDVTDPEGALVEVDKTQPSGLTKLRDCPGEDNRCRGLNTEHIVLQNDFALPTGPYKVRVRLEKTHGAEAPIRVRVAARLGPRSYAAELVFEKENEEQELVWEL